MTADASEVLGAPQVAGTFVSPKGLTKRMTSAAVAVFGTPGYLALTADELAIVRAKPGLLKPRLGSDVVARVPRSEIASAQLDPSTGKEALTIQFAEGVSWEFEVRKTHRKTAEQVVEALGGHVG